MKIQVWRCRREDTGVKIQVSCKLQVKRFRTIGFAEVYGLEPAGCLNELRKGAAGQDRYLLVNPARVRWFFTGFSQFPIPVRQSPAKLHSTLA